VASYGAKKALALPSLIIRPGEKVGVLGPIGAGKTTLLRLLSGMYKPQEGRILLDDIDLGHLSKPVLAEHIDLADLGLDSALNEIERGNGIQYDAETADACLMLFREDRYALPA